MAGPWISTRNTEKIPLARFRPKFWNPEKERRPQTAFSGYFSGILGCFLGVQNAGPGFIFFRHFSWTFMVWPSRVSLADRGMLNSNHEGETHPKKATHPNNSTVCANNFGTVCTNCPPNRRKEFAQTVCANCFLGCGFFAYSWKLPAYSRAFLLTVDNFSFFLTVGAFLLTVLAFLRTVGAFFAYSGKVRLIRA